MLRRTLLALLVALVASPILFLTVSAQEPARQSHIISCMSTGTGSMVLWNRSDHVLEMYGYALTANGPSLEGTLTVGPWEQSVELKMTPDSPPVNGWWFEIVDLDTGELLVERGYTNEECGYIEYPDETPVPTIAPVPNGFSLLTAQRMCTDQSFHATWSGANVATLEFSLSNTSDNWTSGWIVADTALGAIHAEVDHHAYDKVVAQVTYADGSADMVDADVGTCTESSAPPAPPTSAETSTVQVTSLPSTGTGFETNTILVFSAFALIASACIVAGSLRNQS